MRYCKLVIVTLLPAIIYIIPRNSLFNHTHTLCLFKNIFGIECWGCGITRAIASVMYFEFNEALSYNKLVVVVLPLLVYLWIKEMYKEYRFIKHQNKK